MAGKTEKAKRYEQINVPREKNILERIDKLAAKLSKELGVSVDRWVVVDRLVAEAERGRK